MGSLLVKDVEILRKGGYQIKRVGKNSFSLEDSS